MKTTVCKCHKTIENGETINDSKKTNFLTDLVRNDNNFSTVNFFLVASTIVGITLLVMPMIAIYVDLYFNHTITLNLSDMSAYILAVSGIFAAAGLTNAWTEYSYQKYNTNIFENDNNLDIPHEHHTNFGQL